MSVPGSFFARGADIGWLQQMEATGYIFRDLAGNPCDCLQILKEHGINSIRLRVWVNPNDDPRSGHNSMAEVAVIAKRVYNMGFRLMIDFHYSDSWADPGKQFKPKAWEGHSVSQLAEDVYHHTYQTLSLLKKNQIDVDWVQVGNEIPNGMIWPEGHSDYFEQLVLFINSGYHALKDVYQEAQAIVHLDQGNNSHRFRDFFDRFTEAKGLYDLIGMSYYPYWLKSHYLESIDQLQFNINDMIQRYDKDVMITEIGGLDTEPDVTYDMIRAVIQIIDKAPHGRGKGLFYWEPQGARSWSGYALSAWGDDSRPTRALQAFIPD